jgi:hypothetical protein
MSTLTLKPIAENKKTLATFLDLGHCNLTKVARRCGKVQYRNAVNHLTICILLAAVST